MVERVYSGVTASFTEQNITLLPLFFFCFFFSLLPLRKFTNGHVRSGDRDRLFVCVYDSTCSLNCSICCWWWWWCTIGLVCLFVCPFDLNHIGWNTIMPSFHWWCTKDRWRRRRRRKWWWKEAHKKNRLTKRGSNVLMMMTIWFHRDHSNMHLIIIMIYN